MTPFEQFCETHHFTGTDYPLWSSTADRNALARLFGDMGFKVGAEIGVWEGLFSEQLCLANPGVQLTCVDPWLQYKNYSERKNNQERLDWAYGEACKRLALFGCRLLRMSSAKAAKQIPDRSLDFVYIDGNHMHPFVDEDLALWSPKVRAGGIVAGHDYEIPPRKAPWIDVRDAVNTYTAAHQIAPWYVVGRERKAPSFFWVVQ
jgi:hypothetical protein